MKRILGKEVYIKNLKVTLRDNSSAYGYSILITAVYATLNVYSTATIDTIFMGVIGAAMGFVAVESYIVRVFHDVDASDTQRTKTIARLMHAISIGCGVGCAAICGAFFNGYAAWFIGALFATVSFILIDGIELSIVEEDVEK